MSFPGRKTEATYRRYAIVDSAAEAEAAALLDGHEEQQGKIQGKRGMLSVGSASVSIRNYSGREWRNWQTRWT
jgi:hypothetical protein